MIFLPKMRKTIWVNTGKYNRKNGPESVKQAPVFSYIFNYTFIKTPRHTSMSRRRLRTGTGCLHSLPPL